MALLACAVLAGAAPAYANNTQGAWSPVTPWPLIAVHAVLMPDGRVLSYGTKADGTQTGIDIYDIWDPSAGLNAGHTTLPNTSNTDLFCSSQLVLPAGGQVFIAGGDNWTGTGTTNTGNRNSNLINFTNGNDTISRQADMNRPRWYSSSTTLLNGETYIQGGSGGTDRPEIRDANGAFRLLNGANTSTLDFMFPRNFIAPNGRVFGYDSGGRMYYVDPAGSGSITMAGQFSGPTGSDATAAMFRPGRILQFGGNSSGALVIDITGGTPSVTTTQSLSSRRRLVNATILADGRVLATGGSDVWNEMTNVAYTADIWNPATGTWTRGAAAQRARLYHSNAILMPDASVLVMGGGAPGPQNNTNIEVYYPPYLYNAAGGAAVRPVIVEAPSTIDVGETFEVRLGSAATIGRVVMIKTTSASHSFNFEQRFVELTFQQNGDRLVAQAPTRATDSPPGFYMLFVLNAAGTPSIAPIVRVPVAPVINPSVTPVIVNPGAQSGAAGTPVSLQLSATDPNGDTLTYGASGLPTGVFVNAVTGAVTGTPSAAGTFNVVVSATDGVNTDSESFVWTIAAGPPFVLNTPPPPAPSTTGSSVTYTASVSGGTGIQYRWDFGDGTPPTAFTSSPTIQHTFAAPGIYYVMITARDAGGTELITTIVQTVHYPLTANRPAISGNIAFEDRATGVDRIWMVNQDHNSVSAFRATTNGKLATITVGTAPRAIALRPNEAWVTNKQSATISVIDTTSLAVARTIALPFASQPFGIVADPTGGTMYVALEALGRVLKLDAATGGVLGSVDVGPNVRHLSLSGDGTRLYASRFITRPLPGESTQTVQTTVAGQPVGGEVVVVNAPAMSVLSTIVLRHSEKPDFENQGRGIPNYLGAVAISPDGRSAWVPSKQDNVKRGTRRDGQALDFKNTVRAISSRIDLAAAGEDYPARIDHDNSGLASAIAFDRVGVYAFVALETSRHVAVVDVNLGHEVFRFNVGRAPQGLALSADGKRLYVNNFMDRTLGVYDLDELLTSGVWNVPLVANVTAHAGEKLTAQVLQGKKLFYDALDTRLARDAYISCASCHNDGGHDGRTWDLTGFGEGLRNTVGLRGRGGLAQGFLHWSANFDEVQDFEGQIRNLAGGTGLMTNADFNAGTRSTPLGDAKAGLSADLDALAAYVASLNAFASSPMRNADGSLTAAAVAGRAVFTAKNCASCHGGPAFTRSASNNPADIGTIDADSGKRLAGALVGIDVPTLRDAWATAPYLHRGSAATLGDAIRAHAGVSVTDIELANLVSYVAQIGDQETAPGSSNGTPRTGTGLRGRYFNNMSLEGAPVLERVERVTFSWPDAPGPGVSANQFSVRWTGFVEASATGSFQFQTRSNDGVRVWINGNLVIDHWAAHGTADAQSAPIAMVANQRYPVTIEYYDNAGSAVARLFWKAPATDAYVAVPVTRLYAD